MPKMKKIAWTAIILYTGAFQLDNFLLVSFYKTNIYIHCSEKYLWKNLCMDKFVNLILETW